MNIFLMKEENQLMKFLQCQDQNQHHRGPPRVLGYSGGGLARVICFVDVLAG